MEGGENEFVDGYRLLDIIRRNHPEIWKVMTTMPIEWLDTGCIGRDKVNRQLFFPQTKHQNRKNGNVWKHLQRIYTSLGPKDRGWLWFRFLTGLGLWWEIRCRFLQGPFSAHGRAQLGWRGHRDKVQQSGKYISRWIPRMWYKPNISLSPIYVLCKDKSFESQLKTARNPYFRCATPSSKRRIWKKWRKPTRLWCYLTDSPTTRITRSYTRWKMGSALFSTTEGFFTDVSATRPPGDQGIFRVCTQCGMKWGAEETAFSRKWWKTNAENGVNAWNPRVPSQ